MSPQMETDSKFHISGVSHTEKDFQIIKALMISQKSSYFGQPQRDIYYPRDFFLGYAAHRMIVREVEGAIRCIGYAQFTHYPIIQALPKECWLEWLNNLFCTPSSAQMSQTNTIFMNRFIYSKEHNPQLLLSVLSEVFLREPKVRYVAVVRMPEISIVVDEYHYDNPNYECLEPYAKIIYPREFSVLNCKNTQRIYIIYRDTIIDKMRYRKALPEDNDDIVEVIDFDRPDLRAEYGDYYIAEELLRDDRDEHSVFIVAEINHQTIGFIWLNDAVDIMRLVRNFQLEPFGNLINYNRQENYLQKRIKVTGTERKPDFKLFSYEAIQEMFDESILGKLLINERASSFSLGSAGSASSAAMLRVISHQGIIETSNERFWLRAEFLRKMQKIDNKLRQRDYYNVQFKKNLRIVYNVPAEHSYASDSQFPYDEYSNVFAVQLFGIHIAQDVRRLYRFLATAFSAFPDRDYCILSIPSASKMTRCLYELLKYFMPVLPRPGGVIADRLYITHRSSIYGDVSIQPVRKEDVYFLEAMMLADKRMYNQRLSHMSMSSFTASNVPPEAYVESDIVRSILDDVLLNPDSEFLFLTIRCGNTLRPIDDNIIVGYCILRRFTVLHKMDKFFEITRVSPYLNLRNAEVILLKVHPLYTYHSDAVFRELARMTGFWQFYYIAPTLNTRKAFTNDLATSMQPIEPRYIRRLHRPQEVPDSENDNGAGLVPPIDFNRSYAIYCHNLKPSRFFGNKDQIVLYGFGEMSKAFLRLLIFNFNTFGEKNSFNCLPHPKVVVIARPGEVEAEYDDTLLCGICPLQRYCWLNFHNYNNFINDTMRRMDLRKWVNFISGYVKRIDRKRNMVIMENDCEVYYDKLLLARTIDFGVPPAITSPDLPPNYCQINTRLDKIVTFHKVKFIRDNIIQNDDISIIVYGSHLRAYEFVNFLLTHGINAKNVQLVLPFVPAERDLHVRFNITYADLKVEEILQEMVEDLGVIVHERMTLTRWITYTADDNISHAVFEGFPDHNEVVLECDLFVSYLEQNIEPTILNMYKRCGLATSKECIEIDDNFSTSDPSIYAMGRSAGHSTLPNHQYIYVAPQERAEKLIRILKLDLQQKGNLEEKYSRPAYFQARLPMSYFITKVTLPKRYLANHLGNDYGHSMVTYDGNFSRVRLNEHGIVEEIVCVTRKYTNFDHLQALVGKHEAMLNDMHARWYLGEIRSFVDYFQEPWTELITHSHFEELHETVIGMCQQTATDLWKENPEMDRKERTDLMKRYLNNLGTTRDIEKVLLEYLRKYRNDFVHPFALPEDFETAH